MSNKFSDELCRMLKMAECVERLNTRELDRCGLFLKDLAIERWKDGDLWGVLITMSNEQHMNFVADNWRLLKEIGKYEEAFLHVYTGIRTNYFQWPLSLLRLLFKTADPQKLREAGDPVPDQATFTLYRGVSGVGKNRRMSSFSWTESPNTAAWFAKRSLSLPTYFPRDPAVFVLTVPNESIMACCMDRNEKEYLLRLPLPAKPKRLKELPEALPPRDEEPSGEV